MKGEARDESRLSEACAGAAKAIRTSKRKSVVKMGKPVVDDGDRVEKPEISSSPISAL